MKKFAMATYEVFSPSDHPVNRDKGYVGLYFCEALDMEAAMQVFEDIAKRDIVWCRRELKAFDIKEVEFSKLVQELALITAQLINLAPKGSEVCNKAIEFMIQHDLFGLNIMELDEIDARKAPKYAVVYHDDGPEVPGGQYPDIAYPWTKVYLFETEEEARDWMKDVLVLFLGRKSPQVMICGGPHLGTSVCMGKKGKS
jgi:hypothetical protein